MKMRNMVRDGQLESSQRNPLAKDKRADDGSFFMQIRVSTTTNYDDDDDDDEILFAFLVKARWHMLCLWLL